MQKIVALIALLLSAPAHAWEPQLLTYHEVPTTAQWNALFGGVIPAAASPYNVVCDGTTNAAPGINAAIAAAAAGGNATVVLPPGTCNIPMANGVPYGILMKSGVRLQGQGRGITLLHINDSAVTGSGDSGITNCTGGGSCPSVSNVSMSDFTIYGDRPLTTANLGTDTQVIPYLSDLIVINHYSNLEIHDVEARDSNHFGIGAFSGSGLYEHHNIVPRTNSDCMPSWSVSDAVVTNNHIDMCGDDSISMAAGDTDTPPLRSRLVVANNVITNGPGVSILGAKNAIVTDNVISRPWGNGIWLGYDAYYVQGDTPVSGNIIRGNVITDLVSGAAWNPYQQAVACISLFGSSRQAAGGGSPPGQPTSGTGAVPSLYGTVNTPGQFYAGGQLNVQGGHTANAGSSVASSGGYWNRIEDNTCVRTLPAITDTAPSGGWKDWGYANSANGNAWQAGTFGAHTGVITDGSLRNNGIALAGALSNTLIRGNIIDMGGDWALSFDPNAVNNDYDQVLIADNQFIDFDSFGVLWGAPSPTTFQNVILRNNIFNGDPRFRATGRGSNGTWGTSGQTPDAIYLAWVNGVRLEGNTFQNVARVTGAQGSGAFQSVRGNIIRGQPLSGSLGFSTSNRGVGEVFQDGVGWSYEIVDSDPTSSTYGQLLQPDLTEAAAMPTTGRFVVGHVVRNTSVGATGVFGWQRITTGANNVLGTDWRALGAYGATATGNPSIPGVLSRSANAFVSYSGVTITSSGGSANLGLGLNDVGATGGTVAAGTLVLPAVSGLDPNSEVTVVRYGTTTITSLTVSAADSTPVVDAPTTLSSSVSHFTMIYVAGNWQRRD